MDSEFEEVFLAEVIYDEDNLKEGFSTGNALPSSSDIDNEIQKDVPDRHAIIADENYERRVFDEEDLSFSLTDSLDMYQEEENSLLPEETGTQKREPDTISYDDLNPLFAETKKRKRSQTVFYDPTPVINKKRRLNKNDITPINEGVVVKIHLHRKNSSGVYTFYTEWENRQDLTWEPLENFYDIDRRGNKMFAKEMLSYIKAENLSFLI